jgi:O-methyltransferase
MAHSSREPGTGSAAADPRLLYLDLMKKCLTYYLWGSQPREVSRDGGGLLSRLARTILIHGLARRRIKLFEEVPFDEDLRINGRDLPLCGDTMIGLKRLDNLQMCIERAIADGVPGDLIETGVWKGGAAIFMRAVLKAYGIDDRNVWAADSFEGLPAPDAEKYPADSAETWHLRPELRVSLGAVRKNFERYGLLDPQVKFLKGWFRDTLPQAPIERLAVLRMDGDLYESTMDALTALYPRLSPGGYAIVDDYGIPSEGCRLAVHDYRRTHGINEPIVDIDGWGAYWRRS